MSDFSARLYNYPAERLIKPRRRLAGIEIPEVVSGLLPFKEKPLENVTTESDFIVLIDYFCWIIEFDNVSDFREFVETNSLFLSHIDSSVETKSKINHALKYLFSIKRMVQGLMADDSAYSFHLPYLGEAVYDLECSMALVEMGYFKQSLQTLRSVLEVTVYHAYYSFQGFDLDDLYESVDGRMPDFKMMIQALRAESLFSPSHEQELFSMYRSLNGAVHSQVSRLNSTRNFASKSTFSEWYEHFIKVCNLYIATVFRMLEVGV